MTIAMSLVCPFWTVTKKAMSGSIFLTLVIGVFIYFFVVSLLLLTFHGIVLHRDYFDELYNDAQRGS